ncbi:hypothetical protein T484DRAFT_1650275, partial [Baffinella frigidus]
HPTPYTLHPAPYTLHPAPYTLHPTPYTLHPKPQTLNHSGRGVTGGGARCNRGHRNPDRSARTIPAGLLTTPHEAIHANRFISQLLDYCPGNTPKVSNSSRSS